MEKENECCVLLKEFIENHKEFEGGVWITTMCKMIAVIYRSSDAPFECYRADMIDAVSFYRKAWDKNG